MKRCHKTWILRLALSKIMEQYFVKRMSGTFSLVYSGEYLHFGGQEE